MPTLPTHTDPHYNPLRNPTKLHHQPLANLHHQHPHDQYLERVSSALNRRWKLFLDGQVCYCEDLC